MSEAIPFEKPKPKKISWKEFSAAIKSAETHDRTQATMVKVFSVKDIIVPPTKSASYLGAGPMGTLQPHPDKNQDVIITSEEFPEYLVSEGLSRADAIEVSALSVVAYGALHKWFGGLRQAQKISIQRDASRHSMLPIKHRRFWSSDLFNQEVSAQSPHAIVHRMAACIAIEASGGSIQNIDPDARPPYPVHIAALFDPFEKGQARELYLIPRSV